MKKNQHYIGKKIKVHIDRPLHSKHPKHGFEYMANYGFVPGTRSADGEEIDVYVLGIDKPIEDFFGTCVAVIHRTNDNDDKLVVVPDDKEDISDEDIQAQINFQEQYFNSIIIRK